MIQVTIEDTMQYVSFKLRDNRRAMIVVPPDLDGIDVERIVKVLMIMMPDECRDFEAVAKELGI